jgi:hypothetical protein
MAVAAEYGQAGPFSGSAEAVAYFQMFFDANFLP